MQQIRTALSIAALIAGAVCLLVFILLRTEQGKDLGQAVIDQVDSLFTPVEDVEKFEPMRSLPGWENFDTDEYRRYKRVTSKYRDFILLAAYRNSLDPDLIRAVILVESHFKATAKSHVGAAGLMQLMPGTAKEVGVKDIYDPKQNISGGAIYLRRMLERFNNDLKLALAAYNAGPGAVERHDGIPPYRETRRYVVSVIEAYNILQGRDRSATGAWSAPAAGGGRPGRWCWRPWRRCR